MSARVKPMCTGCKKELYKWGSIYDCGHCQGLCHRRCIPKHECGMAGVAIVFTPIQRHHWDKKQSQAVLSGTDCDK